MRHPNRQTQLDWSDQDEMHWEELPADVRDHLRERLAALLCRAACSREGADDA
jgi:hypothetical protein